jgi:3-mercaptopyruvate sulfurtransferase SseA
MPTLPAILFVTLTLVLAAGNPLPLRQAGDPPASMPRITVEELKKLLGEGRVVVVDVRDAESYAGEHLRGAVSMPLDEVVARAKSLPQDKVIVTYCA